MASEGVWPAALCMSHEEEWHFLTDDDTIYSIDYPLCDMHEQPIMLVQCFAIQQSRPSVQSSKPVQQNSPAI